MPDTDYIVPKVWTWDDTKAGEWSKVNRPVAGATHEAVLPVGDNALQLYSTATPNGQKVTILLEELVERGITAAEYDAWPVRIGEGDQFSTGFVALNPNSKIPVLFDKDTGSRVFESGAILLYLAEKFRAFLPDDPAKRTETLNWLFWLQGAAPYLGGGFGHFYHYAPEKIRYAIDRFTMETKRQLSVLDQELAKNRFLGGEGYTIADIATWPWFGNLARGVQYDAGEFLQVDDYPNVQRWAEEINARPAVQRGRKVNRSWGPLEDQLHERHHPSDFDLRTEDKKATAITA